MPHARETIRNAAVALLTGLSTTGARVYKDRLQSRPLETSELPCILVTTGGETVEGSTVHAPAVIQRELELQVIGVVRALTGLDDTLDDIALEVETALSGGTLSTKADVALASIDEPSFDGSVDMPVARQTMRFRVTYATAANAPGTLI
jgi:hypothetical protein